ncbi:cbb3-type cytochrome oxidase assembly protein CcoS [Polynucleobacter sp. 30F-ANTBAC]|jgi:cbb3-type cytochrome oxidase maturation protein|uniref:cbb3-type cytochrome oxidase assembly protein CcoS n=1 Tax=Polynucleobacter sp. 30F-ANTBAC TaxID=2689095 RepID=UPI001C0C9EFB|nr:cbb3-type cytochrome oxidase assembly protein CcoS [Polynucleobacter sp. 30F-ANTBAC]MBU3599320.1 cbb3-type cytochrome oxidase assembly protein CcoS [Polynucleobacter sp. 30F-ANTBAC]
MESLYLLIPMSLVVVAFIVFVLYWSVRSGQFEDLEGPGHAILMDDDNPKPKPQSNSNSLSKDN